MIKFLYGKMTERFNVVAWKAAVVKATAGYNLFFPSFILGVFVLKKVFAVIGIFLASLIVMSLIGAYFLFLHHYKGRNIVNEWHDTDKFNIENISTVEKQKDKEFVILNLADIQICDLENFFNKSIIHDEITYLVEQTKPDLITLTGDQTWSNENLLSLKSIIKWLDGYKIPYAPVFGNHDYGNEKNSSVAELNYCCDLYESGKYSLFKRGPSNLGTLGNYVVNIVEDGKIYKTLYMLDSGYEDKITDQQIAWFEWNANGIKEVNGDEYVESMCFMHKPLPEYRSAFFDYVDGEAEAIGEVHIHFSLNGSTQNGFFEVAKSVNVVDIVCGHQHGNNFTIKYENVRLTFATKTGELATYYDDGDTNLNGGTIFKLDGENTTIENIYVDRDKFHINGSDN